MLSCHISRKRLLSIFKLHWLHPRTSSHILPPHSPQNIRTPVCPLKDLAIPVKIVPLFKEQRPLHICSARRQAQDASRLIVQLLPSFRCICNDWLQTVCVFLFLFFYWRSSVNTFRTLWSVLGNYYFWPKIKILHKCHSFVLFWKKKFNHF